MSATVGPAEPLLATQGLGKRYGAVAALDQVSFEVHAGQVHCLLGENGAGKSTLCQLLAGAQLPTAGAMRLAGAGYAPRSPQHALASGVAMAHQHFSLIPTLSALDNLALGRRWFSLDRAALASAARALQAQYGFDVPLEALAGNLSIGQLQQLEIVKCLLRRPRLLLLDEPTAVLTPQAIAPFVAAVRRMAQAGLGIVLVTHKLREIEAAADWVTVLRNGRLVDQGALTRRSVQSFVSAMVGSEPAALRPVEAAPPAPSLAAAGARDLLMVDGATLLGPRGQRRLDTVTLTVAAREVVGLAGVDGNGQTELAAALAGMRRLTEGRIFVGGGETTRLPTAEVRARGVAVVPEDRHRDGCIAELPLAHNLFIDQLDRFSRRGRLDERALMAAARQRMAEYDIRAAGPDQTFGRLSGGNQQKAVLARELGRDGVRAVVAVHPTRGLDLGAVRSVYTRLLEAAQRGAAVLVVSSELDELMAYCDRILVFFKGRVASQLRRADFARERLGALMAGASP